MNHPHAVATVAACCGLLLVLYTSFMNEPLHVARPQVVQLPNRDAKESMICTIYNDACGQPTRVVDDANGPTFRTIENNNQHSSCLEHAPNDLVVVRLYHPRRGLHKLQRVCSTTLKLRSVQNEALMARFAT